MKNSITQKVIKEATKLEELVNLAWDINKTMKMDIYNQYHQLLREGISQSRAVSRMKKSLIYDLKQQKEIIKKIL